MKQNETCLREACALAKASGTAEKNGLSVLQLPGDASTRRYFRVRARGGDVSWVMMLMDPYQRETNNFLLVQAVLARSGVPVPAVLADLPEEGAILLDDLGDRTMLHHLEASMKDSVELDFFRRAIDLLVDIHAVSPTAEEKAKVKGFSIAFDEEILNWEVNFTLEHFLKNYLKREIPPGEIEEIKAGFGKITQALASEPRVFTHRDYHTRNIMIDPKHRYVSIDFQDARMGLRQYDLASLLRDSYYQLSEEKVYGLLDYYLERIAERGGGKIDRDEFVRMFDLMSIQRNFKAIGSFASFYIRRDNARYLRFIGNTFENVRRNLAKFPEYKRLHQLLFNWYYF